MQETPLEFCGVSSCIMPGKFSEKDPSASIPVF
jgi:hypothetical protein